MRIRIRAAAVAAFTGVGVLLLSASPGAAGSKSVTSHMSKALSPNVLSAMTIPLTCRLNSGGAASRVYIENSSTIRIVAQRPIRWRSAGGDQGVVSLPFPLDPGKVIAVATTPAAAGCTAWLERPALLLSQ
jgi:hypothetical protein